jgi:hypothetical protein
MGKDASDTEPQFGFFSVVALAGGTLVGGYLVLNALGRPVEFHCTEAVKPTRAQEILYGPTLSPFLYAEQLGRSLIVAAKSKTDVVFTDSKHALDLRRLIDVPVVMVRHADDSTESEPTAFQIGTNQLCTSSHAPEDQRVLTEDWEQQFVDWDLSEPFTRIQDAIAETHKAA